MMEYTDKIEIELMYVIVNSGNASKILKAAKQHGIKAGTIFLGKGTVKGRLLEFLNLYDIRKEIIMMISEKNTAYQVLEYLNNEIHFDKPHHGIAFTTPVIGVIGTRCYNCNDYGEKGANNMYNAIFTIVDKGKAEDVIDAAIKAGSTGGTIINARGSGIHETSKLFSMEIEPEKEIVLILAEDTTTETIISSIKENLKIDEPGNGVIFVQSVNKTYGLFQR